MFVYELSGCGFESRSSHLNFRYRVFLEDGVPEHSGKKRVSIQAEKDTAKCTVQITTQNLAQSLGQFCQIVE